jgi:hypothetical protein
LQRLLRQVQFETMEIVGRRGAGEEISVGEVKTGWRGRVGRMFGRK